MDSEEPKPSIVISRDGQQVIYLTKEQMNEYAQCLHSKRFFNNMLSFAAGAVAYVTIPVKASTTANYYLKKTLLGTGVVGIVSVIAHLGSVVSCAPVLQKIMNSRMDNTSESGTQERTEEKDESSTKELLDFTPSISSHDFSGPLTFSSDTSGLNKEDSQESGDKTGAAKKRVTYDDLWRQYNQETSQPRAKPKEYRSERADTGSTMESAQPNWEKKKIRTNKYGDILE